ncbi:unnamed protein product [Choristocarpus tenellus]
MEPDTTHLKDNDEHQKEEIEVLEAIYGDDFEVDQGGHTRRVCLRIARNPEVKLVMYLPPKYPSHGLPAYKIQMKNLSTEKQAELSEGMHCERSCPFPVSVSTSKSVRTGRHRTAPGIRHFM